MAFMRKFDKVHSKVEYYSIMLAGLLIIMMMSLITLEVLLRRFMNYSIPGIFEISGQLMVGVSLLGIAHVQKEKEHISVDLFENLMPRLMVKISNIFIFLLGAIITGVFAWQGFLEFWNSFQRGEHTIGILLVPIWPGRLIVAFSMFLLCIRFIFDLIYEILGTPSEKNTEKT